MTRGPKRRRTTAVAALAIAAACLTASCAKPGHATSRPFPAVVTADSAWPATLGAVRSAIGARDFRAADALLTAFVARYPDSSAAAEASYWWALVRLDPANRGADRTGAIAALDAYRATDPPRHHAMEAELVRALVAQQDSLRLALAFERTAAAVAAGAAANARAALVPRDSLRVRDDELTRLRAEAAAANAELDRVRRRLTASGARSRP